VDVDWRLRRIEPYYNCETNYFRLKTTKYLTTSWAVSLGFNTTVVPPLEISHPWAGCGNGHLYRWFSNRRCQKRRCSGGSDTWGPSGTRGDPHHHQSFEEEREGLKTALKWLTEHHHIGRAWSAVTVRHYSGQLTTSLKL